MLSWDILNSHKTSTSLSTEECTEYISKNFSVCYSQSQILFLLVEKKFFHRYHHLKVVRCDFSQFVDLYQ